MRRGLATGLTATFVCSLLLGAPANAASAAASKPGNGPTAVATPAAKPTVSGPTYHFTSGNNSAAPGEITVMWSSLPFNYTFEFGSSMESRRFRTTTGKICNWTDVYSTEDVKIQVWVDTFGIDVNIAPTISYPASGGTHYYCWNVNNNNTYYLKFIASWAQGSGSVTAS